MFGDVHALMQHEHNQNSQIINHVDNQMLLMFLNSHRRLKVYSFWV